MRLALALALLLVACTSDASGPGATRSASASSGANTTSATPPAPSSSASAGLPSGITTCELADAHYGDWYPRVDDVVAAARVLPGHCFQPEDRAAAVRACATKLNAARLKVGVGSLEEGVTCDETFLPATWSGRRWIVLEVSAFSVKGAVATGSAFAAELRAGTAVRYIDNTGLWGDCSSADKAPNYAPEEWTKLPVDLARFLCGFRK